MTNKHGLDARYFKEKLGQLVRDADNYTPAEMSRALKRYHLVALRTKMELKHENITPSGIKPTATPESREE